MQRASYGKAREPSDPLRRAGPTRDNNSTAEENILSDVPPIVVQSESLEGSWEPAVQGSRDQGRFDSLDNSSSHESLDLDAQAIGYPIDNVEIPKIIECYFTVTFDGTEAPVAANRLAIDYTESNSYRKVEKFTHDIAQDVAQDNARLTSSGTLVARQFNFKYGNCNVIDDRVERIGLPLTTREDWDSVCTILVNYWRTDPLRTLRVEIYRDYFSFRSQATSEISVAATKRRELHNLFKKNSENGRYVPRIALMRFSSEQNIREIITRDDRLSMGPEEKEHFIKKVQANAPCLLAQCVYARLNMECLNIFLEKGFSDAAFPQATDCCHEDCAPDFNALVDTRGGFRPARFDKVGEHQDFGHSDVIPIHFVPVEKNQDEVMKAGRQRDLEEGTIRTTGMTDDAKHACCGSGAFSSVYRVRIDPDHHRLQKDKDGDFALKEFIDRPDRGDSFFQRELKMLDELRRHQLQHIVTHVATWTHRGRYCMLFPYAQCNLRQYMKWIQFGDPTKDHTIWLTRQFRGLAEGIKGIHDLSGTGALQSALDVATHPEGERRAGYHHDLKPENILYYKDTGNFEISDFGAGKVHTYRSGSYNSPSRFGTPTYEPPEVDMEGGTSRPYDMWSLGCVFLILLIWAVFGFQAVEEFEQKRVDKRYPGSPREDDAFWQTLPNGHIILRRAVEDMIKTLGEAVLQQRDQPFEKIFNLVIRMLDPVKKTRIPALDLFDTLDRIYKQKKFDLESIRDGSVPDSNDMQERSPAMLRLSMDPPDRRSPETRDETSITVRNAGDFLAASPVSSTSPRFPVSAHRRNSSASEFVGPSRNTSIASSNMSTHGRRGSTDEQRN